MSHLSLRQKYLEAFLKDPAVKTNIIAQIKGSRFYISFNRPSRYNAFTLDMYYTFTNLIAAANANPDVKYIIVSGKGGNFSSGNDLSNFGSQKYLELGTMAEQVRQTSKILEELGQAIIKSPKPIYAITEGKIIGFAFTQLLLYDRVFAVQSSQFHAPLVKLAQGPEMCSSFTFPKVFGQRQAEQLLVGGKKVNAAYLSKFEVVSVVRTREEAQKQLEDLLKQTDQLEWNSFRQTRRLMRFPDRKVLLTMNRLECSNLVERWSHPDFPAYIMHYMAKIKQKSKL